MMVPLASNCTKASSAVSMMARAICSLSSSASCAFFLALMSRATLAAPMIAPDCDLTGETLRETSIRCPSL